VVLALFFSLGCIAGAFAAEKAATKKAPAVEKKTVTGTVVAVKKDTKGNVTRVAIKTDSEQITVAKAEKGKDLLKMLDKKVEAKGTLKETQGKKILTVSEVKEVK
jgi:hypothetical protein